MNMKRIVPCLLVLVPLAGANKARKPPEPSPLDRYVEEAIEHPAVMITGSASPGSLWNPVAPLVDLVHDPKASQVDDLVTILVSERASGTATGTTKSSRKADTKGGITGLWGPRAGRIADLAKMSSDTNLQGQGTTSRESVLTTTLSARVTHLLPNGYLVVEGSKDTMVNSERQLVTVRGVVRPTDLSTGNVVRSDRLAQLEVRINGKGVVGDAVRRPFFLYRLLTSLLPF